MILRPRTKEQAPVRLEKADLLKIVRSTSAEQRLVQRTRIVVARVFEECSVAETARRCGVTPKSVRKWEKRFRKAPVLASLRDEERTGRPKRLGARDEAVVLSLACQGPAAVGRLEARMTQEIIAEEAAKQGSPMSRSSVQRVLASADVKPHKNEYYLFTPKDHPEYESRRDDICDLYTQPLPPDEIVVCFDEKSGIQVLRAPVPGRRCGPGGKRAKTEFEYQRLGARTLAVAMRVDTGELIAWDLFPAGGYKTAQAIEMLRAIAAALPHHRVIHLVWDNASTHRSEEMKRFLASDGGQRFQLHYTPTHASWLNQAETVFAKFTRRFLAHRRYESLADFDATIFACLEIYNATVASPCRWRYNPRQETRAAA
jgi:transposase